MPDKTNAGAADAFPSLMQAAARLRARGVTSVELTQSCLARIREHDGEINSFITVTADSALHDAEAADAELQSGHWRGPLHGIPVALKDLIDVAGVKTTAASALLQDNVAHADAEVTRRLRRAGAILLGKLNLHEFAYGGSGVISNFGPARNPADMRHITGGSSSGSAAAVAAGFCFAALGTDTAGSIRLPAACCGVVGFKPTYAAVSVDGVIELARSYDHVGPLTRTVADARAVWQAIRGVEGQNHSRPSQPLRLGALRKYFFDDLDGEVAQAMDRALAALQARYELKDTDFPVEPDRTVQMRESWNYHERWVAEAPDKYDPQTLKRIRAGEHIEQTEFRRRLHELRFLRASVPAMFEAKGVDLVVTPTVPIPAPAFADVMADPESLRARELILLRNTRPFNVWGMPTISIPCGVTSSGLPIGIQFAAAPGHDDLLLDFTEEFEQWQRV